MNLNRLFQSIRASRDVSHAIREGRAPSREDLVILGLDEVFDRARLARKPLD